MPADRGRRQHAGRAVTRVGPADGAEGGLGAVHEIVAVAAVDVKVDEARREVGAGEVDRFVRGGERPRWTECCDVGAVDEQPTVREQAIFENQGAAGEEERAHGGVRRFLPS